MNLFDKFIIEHNTAALMMVIGISLFAMVIDSGMNMQSSWWIFSILIIVYGFFTIKNRHLMQKRQMDNNLKIVFTIAITTCIFVGIALYYIAVDMADFVKEVKGECEFIAQGLRFNGSPYIFENLTMNDILYNQSLQEEHGWGYG